MQQMQGTETHACHSNIKELFEPECAIHNAVVWHGVFLEMARTIYIYMVFTRHFWQGNDPIYGHMRCIHTVLASPSHFPCLFGAAKMTSEEIH